MSLKKLLMIYDVSFPFVKGGGQKRFFEIGRRIAENSDNVSWLTFRAWKNSDLEKHKIDYLSLGDMPKLYNKFGNRSKTEPLIFFVKILLNLHNIKYYKNIWIAQWPLLHILPVVIASRLLNKNIIVDWWEVWSLKNWQSYSFIVGSIAYLIQNIYLNLIRFFGCTIITDSILEYKRIKTIIGEYPKLHHIQNGVPHDDIGDVNLNNKLDYDIVNFGRLKNHKAVHILLESIYILKHKYNYLARVGIIGDGPEEFRLKEISKKLSISSQIKFHGQIENPVDFFKEVKKGKICAITTINGGGGNLAVLEAYACGLPVVAFKVEEGIDETYIDNGKTGYFVYEKNPEALADSMIKILTSKSDILMMMKENALLKSKKHSWSNVGKEYSLLLK